MSRFALAAALASLALGCAVPRVYGDDVGLTANLSAGARALDDELYDGGTVYGFELATRDPANGWGYELGVSYGSDETSGPRSPHAEINEYSFGLRRSWESAESRMRPYVGFGGSYTIVENNLDDPDSDFVDRGSAAYAHGGVLWSLGRLDVDNGVEVLAGVDARGSLGDEYDAGQVALVLAFGR